MVDHLALSIGSTGARTGVDTLLLDTGHSQGTLRAEQTLWPAVGRTSEISLQTGTDGAGSFRSTLTVGTTGVRSAGIHLDGSNWKFIHKYELLLSGREVVKIEKKLINTLFILTPSLIGNYSKQI